MYMDLFTVQYGNIKHGLVGAQNLVPKLNYKKKKSFTI